MQYTKRYGLEKHSFILDVDFAVSEACCKLLQQALVIYVNVEQRAHWPPIQVRCWSAVPCDNDVISLDWVKPIGLCHLEFHASALHVYSSLEYLILIGWSCQFMVWFVPDKMSGVIKKGLKSLCWHLFCNTDLLTELYWFIIPSWFKYYLHRKSY